MAARQDELLLRFIALHAGRHRQRTPGWIHDKAGSIGGSEIAALMGHNPYSTFNGVVAAKVGLNPFGGNIACRWGTLFESAIERFVEIDCGTRLRGTDISVPAPATSGLRGRHANSPDGYAVVTLFEDETAEGDPVWRLAATDAATRAAAAGRATKTVIALVEFKCPYRRQPKGDVPKHYKPQIWSGLALSPVAHLGLFVDAVFRRCALWSLGPGAGYDRTYHREREVARWPAPIAWGLTGIYAPRLDAVRGGGRAAAGGEGATDFDGDFEVNAAYEAWLLGYKALGLPPEPLPAAGEPYAPGVVDFGDGDGEIFDTMMLHLDKGRFQSEHVGPCFPDGRGAPLGTAAAIGAAIDRLAAAPPPGHFLLGVLPWKVLEVDYAFMERRPAFLQEIAPLVHRCLDLVEELRAAPNPAQACRARLEGERMAGWAAGKNTGGPAVTPEQVQDLFDDL